MSTNNYLLISDVARIAGVTPWTLREYEREGLLSPERDSTGRRIYDDADAERAKEIAAEKRASRGAHLKKARA